MDAKPHAERLRLIAAERKQWQHAGLDPSKLEGYMGSLGR